MTTVLISFAPLLFGLYFFFRVFRMLRLLRLSTGRVFSRNKSVQERAEKSSPAYFLFMVVLSAVLSYYSLVFGVGNFPAERSFYTFKACENKVLDELLPNDGDVLRFKHIATAIKSCKK